MNGQLFKRVWEAVNKEMEAAEAERLRRVEAERQEILRLELSDVEYSRWFLQDKIVSGRVSPFYALNDFVLFRVAHDWPRNSKWVLDEFDIECADFSLTEPMAVDLVAMAAEGLTDGYRPAKWYLDIVATFYAGQPIEPPQPIFDYLQRRLFLPQKGTQGRKRTDSIDRDRIIRNVFEGLVMRGCALTKAQGIIADTLNMTPDAVRKVIERTSRTEREKRLWAVLIDSPLQSAARGCQLD